MGRMVSIVLFSICILSHAVGEVLLSKRSKFKNMARGPPESYRILAIDGTESKRECMISCFGSKTCKAIVYSTNGLCILYSSNVGTETLADTDIAVGEIISHETRGQ